MAEKYITEEQRAGCRKVADAFAELYELTDVVVADAGLGTINHVGLTVFYMKQKMIPVRGIIFNHYEPGNVLHEDNRKMCESLTGVKVVACVRDGDEELDIPIESLKELYEEEKA